jgi:hypothetical protein
LRPTLIVIMILASLALLIAACEADRGLDPTSTYVGPPWTFPDPQPVTLTSSAILGLDFFPNGTVCAVDRTTIFVSSDTGRTWSSHGGPPAGKNIQCLAIDATGNIFLGADSILQRTDPHDIDPRELNVLRSTDAGASWQRMYALGRPTVPSIVLACNWTGDLIAGMSYSGAIYSLSRGSVWGKVTSPVCTGVAVSNSRIFFATSVKGVVFRSVDLGATWTVCPGLAGEGQASYQSIFTTSAGDTVFVVESSGSGTLYRSPNGGTAWTPVWGGYVTKIARSPRGIYYAAAADQLLRSTDGGTNWYIAGRPGEEITSLGVNGSGVVFVGTRIGTVIRWVGE